MGAQLKKSRSIDAPYGDMRTLHEREGGSGSALYGQNSLPRAKSDFNLALVGAGPMTGKLTHLACSIYLYLYLYPALPYCRQQTQNN